MLDQENICIVICKHKLHTYEETGFQWYGFDNNGKYNDAIGKLKKNDRDERAKQLHVLHVQNRAARTFVVISCRALIFQLNLYFTFTSLKENFTD